MFDRFAIYAAPCMSFTNKFWILSKPKLEYNFLPCDSLPHEVISSILNVKCDINILKNKIYFFPFFYFSCVLEHRACCIYASIYLPPPLVLYSF